MQFNWAIFPHRNESRSVSAFKESNDERELKSLCKQNTIYSLTLLILICVTYRYWQWIYWKIPSHSLDYAFSVQARPNRVRCCCWNALWSLLMYAGVIIVHIALLKYSKQHLSHAAILQFLFLYSGYLKWTRNCSFK